MKTYQILVKGWSADKADYFSHQIRAENEYDAILQFVSTVRNLVENTNIQLPSSLAACENWQWEENDWLMEFRGITEYKGEN